MFTIFEDKKFKLVKRYENGDLLLQPLHSLITGDRIIVHESKVQLLGEPKITMAEEHKLEYRCPKCEAKFGNDKVAFLDHLRENAECLETATDLLVANGMPVGILLKLQC